MLNFCAGFLLYKNMISWSYFPYCTCANFWGKLQWYKYSQRPANKCWKRTDFWISPKNIIQTDIMLFHSKYLMLSLVQASIFLAPVKKKWFNTFQKSNQWKTVTSYKITLHICTGVEMWEIFWIIHLRCSSQTQCCAS